MATNGTNGAHSPHLPYRLDGKVALVTVSGRGIGAAMALQLATCGAKIIVNYAKSAASAAKVVQDIKNLGSDAVAIQADVSKVPEIVRLLDEAKSAFGRLDIVCSNAGVVSFGHLEDVDEVFMSLFSGSASLPWPHPLTAVFRPSSTAYFPPIPAANSSSLAKHTSTLELEAASFS